MTEPTREQILAAHYATEQLALLATSITERQDVKDYKEMIFKALPPKTNTTMADVNWEHSKHFLTVAESTRDEERYIMLCPEMSEHIRCISEDPHRSTEVILREYLVPTDDKYRLNREVL